MPLHIPDARLFVTNAIRIDSTHHIPSQCFRSLDPFVKKNPPKTESRGRLSLSIARHCVKPLDREQRSAAIPTRIERETRSHAASHIPPATKQMSAPDAATAPAADACASRDAKLAHIKRSIRGIPDFPKPGILFWDVTTLMLDVEAFQHTIDLLVERYRDQKIDVVAGFEARGFLFGAPVALALGLPFVPLRKPGKLPGAVISEAYVTEYSTDKIEMHEGHVKPGQRVLLVDDLVATGGTLAAGAALVRKAGGVVAEAACVIELPALKGRDKVGKDVPLFVLIEMEGE